MGSDSSGLKNRVLDGGRQRATLGVVDGQFKKLGVGVSAAVYAAKGIVQPVITARHAMQLFVEIL